MVTESNYDKNKRIAGNTIMLFFRMFLMIFIGLFTSRVILQTLGESDYGTFNAVGGVIAFCSLMTGSVSAAIMRFLTFSLGEGNPEKVHRVFSSSVIIQIFMCVVIGIIVETVGLWWLNSHMVIPDGRLSAAHWVLHCSLGIMAINLLSAPYNAMILSHEKMSAYAFVSILEAVLKLAVALLLMASSFDKLKTYAVLMFGVSVIVRLTYSTYCHHHFQEARGKLVFDKEIVREMSGFVGWNFFSSGSSVFTNAGINLLVNKFFGVRVNAARGVTGQVEGTVKPFAINFLSALNPQLTKSYAEGNKVYTFDLVRKGVKIASLMLLALVIPIILECDYLLELWLKNVPEYSVTFVRIALICMVVDLGMNSPRQLINSSGNIKVYCIVVGMLNILSFVVSWIVFSLGGSPAGSYWTLVGLQVSVDIFCLYLCKKQESFPIGVFIKDVILRIVFVAIVSAVPAYLVMRLMYPGFIRLVVVTLTCTSILCLSSYYFAFTVGERSFVADIYRKIIDRVRR